MIYNFSKYIGIPFTDHGRNESGCDCWGLIRLIYKNEFGIELSDLGPIYKSTTDENGMRHLYSSQLPNWKIVKTPRVGDVVLLRIRGVPIHVGIVVGNSKMIHVERGIDSVIERFTSGIWNNRIEGFYRYAR